MLKRISCLALCMVLFFGILAQRAIAADAEDAAPEVSTIEPSDAAVPAQQETDPETESAADPETGADDVNDADDAEEPETPEEPQEPCILVDGVVVEDAMLFYHNGNAYASLRSVAQALRPDAQIDWVDDHAAVTAEDLLLTAKPGLRYLVANGRYLYLPDVIMMIDYRTMVPVRRLAEAMGAQVYWDAATNSVFITSGTGTIASGDEYYDADVLYLMSHVIYAESGNQSLEGKIAVGNVIQNRVKNPLFPDTYHGVIFQANQFTTATSNTFNRTPNAESVIAAKLCMDGAVVLPTALWFNRAGMNSWAARNKTYVTTIGAHAFYA